MESIDLCDVVLGEFFSNLQRNWNEIAASTRTKFVSKNFGGIEIWTQKLSRKSDERKQVGLRIFRPKEQKEKGKLDKNIGPGIE